MQIHYKDSKIKKLLTDEWKMKKKFGEQATDKIIQRMQELDASENIMDLPPAARAHPHEPKHKEIFSVDILKHKHSMRLLIKPFGEYNITDYKTIKEIEIQNVIKIHS